MKANNDNQPHLISMADAAKLTTLSRTAINQKRAKGEFPQAVELGVKRIAFIREEVLGWINSRVEQRVS